MSIIREIACVVANFGESYLSTRTKFFDSVKSSWPPISRATTYVHLKNLTSDPPPLPLMGGNFLNF